jgi:two-component system, chemotaxis family, protein-glutamate methylesterase/glutaminase
MANRDIVAIGTSAGGVEALKYLAKRIIPSFPAAVLVTIHLPSKSASSLDRILGGLGGLPAAFAKDGDVLRKGQLYLAPPERHLLIDGDDIVLGAGPRENNARPSIDPMLRSAAVCCGPRTVGVVMTGTLGDGASGLWAVARCGGIAIVQDPCDAAFPEMPLRALNLSMPHHVVTLSDLPELLKTLVHQPAGEAISVPDNIRLEVEIARTGRSEMEDMERLGHRSELTCPECNGVMWEIEEDGVTRYRCHIGHAYTARSMSVGLDDNVRRALGTALRTLEERVRLAEKLSKQASAWGHNKVTAHWQERKAEYEREAEIIRKAIARADTVAAAPPVTAGLS